MDKCVTCGGILVRDTRKVVYTYKGCKLEIMQPGLYCEKCGEGYLSKEDVSETELFLSDHKKEIDVRSIYDCNDFHL